MPFAQFFRAHADDVQKLLLWLSLCGRERERERERETERERERDRERERERVHLCIFQC